MIVQLRSLCGTTPRMVEHRTRFKIDINVIMLLCENIAVGAYLLYPSIFASSSKENKLINLIYKVFSVEVMLTVFG